MSTKIYDAYCCKLGIEYTNLIIQQLREEYTEGLKHILKDIPKPYLKTVLKDFDDAIVIYPLKDKILFQVFCNYQLEKYLYSLNLLIRFNKMEDYHYQDQADPWYAYENLSNYDLQIAEFNYEKREKDWNKIFKNSWTPAEAGYTIPLLLDKVKFIYGN